VQVFASTDEWTAVAPGADKAFSRVKASGRDRACPANDDRSMDLTGGS